MLLLACMVCWAGNCLRESIKPRRRRACAQQRCRWRASHTRCRPPRQSFHKNRLCWSLTSRAHAPDKGERAQHPAAARLVSHCTLAVDLWQRKKARGARGGVVRWSGGDSRRADRQHGPRKCQIQRLLTVAPGPGGELVSIGTQSMAGDLATGRRPARRGYAWTGGTRTAPMDEDVRPCSCGTPSPAISRPPPTSARRFNIFDTMSWATRPERKNHYRIVRKRRQYPAGRDGGSACPSRWSHGQVCQWRVVARCALAAGRRLKSFPTRTLLPDAGNIAPQRCHNLKSPVALSIANQP